MKFIYFYFLSLFFSTSVFSQKEQFPVATISDSLKQNANAIVRLLQTDITIASQRNMTVTTKRVVTVLNDKGLTSIDAVEYYNLKTKVQAIEATFYDSFGVEIKHIKRKDFRDQSIIDGITLFTDSRFIYLNYTPTQYPFTIVYESEITTSNTAIIPTWMPLNDYFLSVEKAILNVTFPENLGFKKKEINFNNFHIQKLIDSPTQISYSGTNFMAQKIEDYNTEKTNILPKLMMGLDFFNLEGVDGTAKNWKEFGKWYYENILTKTTELPIETRTKILALVGSETDPIKKAKIVYNYVQQKTRYVSIQVGIGGFKPMLAKDVDRLGYGDCKALSNYTRALLEAVGVESYFTILYGNPTVMDIKKDFFSIQGNHAILTIPDGDKYIGLECTSQTIPFGYQANFTDDRNVIIIKPNGGEIIKTKNYQDKDNAQKSKGKYEINAMGNLSGSISIHSEGSQYDRKSRLEHMSPTDQEAHYKEYWSNINSLKIDKKAFINDKNKVIFTENLEINANNYASISGNKMLFVLNAFNPYTTIIKRIRNRKTPFEIQRGYIDTDEISIELPQNFTIESLPRNIEFSSKFGEYKTEISKLDDKNIVYKRTLFVKKGIYLNTEYEEYRLFMEQISRNDNAKLVLTKNQ